MYYKLFIDLVKQLLTHLLYLLVHLKRSFNPHFFMLEGRLRAV